MTLGNKIQEIRTARGMSQEQFGELLDATRQTVSKWELDQAVPDIRKIVAISRLFCVSADDLLLNVTTFEKEGIRFPCGVYRNATSEIIETEKFAVRYYNKDGNILGARLYEGNGDIKRLVSICEKDCPADSISYAYLCPTAEDREELVGNCVAFEGAMGEIFDRKQLDKMDCTESFLVNHGEFKLHSVHETGIRQCLEEWRKGVRLSVSEEQLFVSICTGKTEYIYSIRAENDNIYCGCSYNIPFELGLRSYGQFFRIRNCGDNSQDFCFNHCDFNYKMPDVIDHVDHVNLDPNSGGENGLWFVKRYHDEEIVLAGCGDDEYTYRKNDPKYERFV